MLQFTSHNVLHLLDQTMKSRWWKVVGQVMIK